MFIECQLCPLVFESQRNKRSFWWRLKSRNGRILATSETYASPGNCQRAAQTVGKELGLNVKVHRLVAAKKK